MAPTIPSSRARTRLPKSTRPSSSTTTSSLKPRPSTSLLGRSSKRDKRTIKHSALLSRISISHPSSQARKRRRPSKKLIADLTALGDALPDALVGIEGLRQGDDVAKGVGVKIKHRSLGSRPGKAKRREREVEGEKERFDVNMARMLGGGRGQEEGQGIDRGRVGGRWKALRGFIEQTMEKREDVGS